MSTEIPSKLHSCNSPYPLDGKLAIRQYDGVTTKLHSTPKRSGGEKRGNSYDRRARKNMLLNRHGDGIACPCSYCGTDLPADRIEADRIDEGGRYVRHNVIPSCKKCNQAGTGRHDMPFHDWLRDPRCIDPMRAIEAAMIARLAR